MSTTPPTSAQEALDLAWNLAHPVKEGQHIPEGTRLLDRSYRNDLSAYTTQANITINAQESLTIRTLDPLPAPEPDPDWLDAPAVLARHRNHAPGSRPSLWVNLGVGMWGHAETTKRAEVWDLRDVTPLYPKGQDR